ncbi:MAG: ATP-dependent DNA helicase RecG [Dehalococcoidia bacterium]|nr:ATP-dependent DNA helicase RecG [Dehalococcoidia bacterium]
MTQNRPEDSQRIERKLEAVRRVLEHEKTLGFKDSAVFGGIDSFFERWVEDPAVRTALEASSLTGPTRYADFDRQQREEWIASVTPHLGVADERADAPSREDPAPVGQPPPTRTASPAELTRGSDATTVRRGAANRGRRAAKPSVPKAAAPVKGSSRQTPPAVRAPKGPPPSLDTLLELPSRIGPALRKLGVTTYREALWAFPRRYLDVLRIADLEAGVERAIAVRVVRSNARRFGGRRLQTTEAIVEDESGTINAIWFGRTWIASSLTPGKRFLLTGRLGEFRRNVQFAVASQEPIPDTDSVRLGDLVPVYPLTVGVTQRGMRSVVRPAAERAISLVSDYLPAAVRESVGLLELQGALRTLHRPKDRAEETSARRRLAFDELFLLQLGLLQRRLTRQQQLGAPIRADRPVLDRFISTLPFELTNDQSKVLGEVLTDIGRAAPMHRLLQGDVGSGKTVVAAAALVIAAANGFQGAIMAPTEVLAEQHMRTLTELFSVGQRENDDGGPYRGFSGLIGGRPLRVALLTGSMAAGTKDSLQKLISAGDVDIAIGTHALIQANISFSNLGLAVVDEQHRFGVEQRASLRNKGMAPHLLVMTATPIPRSLALGIFGDLDVSTIREMPPGRPPIETRAIEPLEQHNAYSLIRDEAHAGRQTFVICPLVEESDAVEARAAVAEHERLSKEVFPELEVGLLHGRMSSKDKDSVMTRFHSGMINVLVSTAVVEVGIDVPNATVMMIEGADRFGLAQLHQYRGRVGRGRHKSYCVLVGDSNSPDAQERLQIVATTSDGFKLAEEDLRLRGPGEFFGTRQSGVPDLSAASLSDLPLLEEARDHALDLTRDDPQLRATEHVPLRQEVHRFWSRVGDDFGTSG